MLGEWDELIAWEIPLINENEEILGGLIIAQTIIVI